MQAKTHYQILGITTEASTAEIKRAFRSLAKKYHPDKAQVNTAEKFNQILKAYQVLIDEASRSYYDQTLAIVEQPIRSSFTAVRNSASRAAYYKVTDTQQSAGWIYYASLIAIYASLMFVITVFS